MCKNCECTTIGCKKDLDHKNRYWYKENPYCSFECIKKNIFKEFDPPFDENKVVVDSDIKFECPGYIRKVYMKK